MDGSAYLPTHSESIEYETKDCDEPLLTKAEMMELTGLCMKSKLKGVVRETRTTLKGTPLITVMEAVVNSIQAAKNPSESRVNIKIIYETVQKNLNSDIISTASKDRKAYVKNFEITDNGQGFTESNLDAFSELYTECKREKGCKGIGRVTWLAVFDHVEVESYCMHNGERSLVRFQFDEDNEVNNIGIEHSDVTEDKTVVRLIGVREEYREKMKTNADKLSEEVLDHCLSYYISENYPEITVQDAEGTTSVTQIFKDRNYRVEEDEAEISGMKFSINHLLSKSSKTNSGSTSFYCANGLVVQKNNILKGVTIADANGQYYSYVLYLSGQYLDDCVSTDRLSFVIHSRGDICNIGLPAIEDISEVVEKKAMKFLKPMVEGYENECRQHAEEYVNKRPEFKYVLNNCPEILKEITPNTDESKLYSTFNQAFADLETKYVLDYEKVSKGCFDWKEDDERNKIFERITETQQAVLAKYMSHRRYIIDLFDKQLCRYHDAKSDKEKYAEECTIHDMLMPRKMFSGKATYDNCNMWMIDERLNYFVYTCEAFSDTPIKKYVETDISKRPDICIFSDKRGDQIMAITIVELKRPDRKDKDVLDQVKEYVKSLRGGKLRDYLGRPIKIGDGAVFYCYILSDIDEEKYAEYLKDEDFSRIYSGRSYYKWYPALSAHVEFIDYDHLLNDVRVRNAIFFNLLNGNNPNNMEPGKY